MQNDEVMLQCPNDLCMAANPESDKYCERCGTSLIRRYLWAVCEGIETCPIGELVAERYLHTSHRIFLDTKPGLLPQIPDEDSLNEIKPYLRLVTYRLQVPQAYGLVTLGDPFATEILLLEQAPIYTDTVPQMGQLMPHLLSVWKQASSLRQLNWLLQIANLWQPLSSEGVASSLLKPQLLRVDGSLLRLLELHSDEDNEPNLSQLGQLWLHLASEAQPSIASFIEQLGIALQQGEVQSAEQLVAFLDRGLAEVGLFASRKIIYSTCTDTGPSRQRNEDACYPASGSTITVPPHPKAIAIVCDGIGGHEGGNVASNLAIATLQQQIEQLPLDDRNLDSINLSIALERFAILANDQISDRNDKENRQGRQRMGTTLVMAVAHRHEMYITHVGDSRAYLITRTGCYQITLDDDVAAREVRLGYAVYRDALQQPSAGSLVQALGMSASVHPTIGRFVIDEDCVFLLCSDGLSDFDLVDSCWETEILPILEGKLDVATATRQLVEIGNTRNGHDNITVALVHCIVNTGEPETPLSYSHTMGTASFQQATVLQSKPQPISDPALQDTQLLPQEHKSNRYVKMLGIGLLGLFISLGGGLLLAYLAKQGKIPNGVWFNFGSIDEGRSPASPSPATDTPVHTQPMFVAKNRIVLNRTASEARAMPKARTSYAPASSQPFSPIKGILPAGSVVEVLGKKQFQEQGKWLNLKVVDVCPSSDSGLTNTMPSPALDDSAPKTQTRQPSKSANSFGATGARLLQQGESAWIAAANIEQDLLPITALSADQMERCSDLTPKTGSKSPK